MQPGSTRGKWTLTALCRMRGSKNKPPEMLPLSCWRARVETRALRAARAGAGAMRLADEQFAQRGRQQCCLLWFVSLAALAMHRLGYAVLVRVTGSATIRLRRIASHGDLDPKTQGYEDQPRQALVDQEQGRRILSNTARTPALVGLPSQLESVTSSASSAHAGSIAKRISFSKETIIVALSSTAKPTTVRSEGSPLVRR